MRTIPHLDIGNGEYKSVGLLGFDFIGALALTFDYEHGRVTATKPDAFKAPTGSPVFAIPVRLGSQQPLADVTLDGALANVFSSTPGVPGRCSPSTTSRADIPKRSRPSRSFVTGDYKPVTLRLMRLGTTMRCGIEAKSGSPSCHNKKEN